MDALKRGVAQAGVAFALLVVAAGMAILAVGFLSAALYLALTEPLGMPLAALATGAVLVVIIVLPLFLLLRPRKPPEPPAASDGPALAAQLGEMLGEQAGSLTRQHPAGTMLAALVAGFVVGSSPRIRAKLSDLLR